MSKIVNFVSRKKQKFLFSVDRQKLKNDKNYLLAYLYAKMGNEMVSNKNAISQCDKCPGDYLCIKCYEYYCKYHITQHSCFNSPNYCKLCPTPHKEQCKKCNFNFCDNHISLHDPCITNCKTCIYAITYCNKCSKLITQYT